MTQDSIRFNLAAEEVVVNTTVKVIASVSATISRDTTEQSLKTSLRDLMKRFIDADWQFSGMTRNSSASGMEDVRVVATTRIPESENYGLDRRREAASLEGLRISEHRTDTTPPVEQLDVAHSNLRQKLLRAAMEELTTINTTLSAQYRLSRVLFVALDEPAAPSRRQMMAASANYGSGFDQGQSEAIGNAVKLSMTARVTLRRD